MYKQWLDSDNTNCPFVKLLPGWHITKSQILITVTSLYIKINLNYGPDERMLLAVDSKLGDFQDCNILSAENKT